MRTNEESGGEDEGDIETKGQGMIALQEDYVSDWTGCYDGSWVGIIHPDAMSHPAKFSRNLIIKIVRHIVEDGLVRPGDVILDPFAGVGLGAWACLQFGLSWVGCELEPRFAALGQQNIDLWNAKFSAMPKWTGQARIINGDSRNLAQLVRGVGVVSSPPYSTGQMGGGGDNNALGVSNVSMKAGYGSTPGQLGAMKAGDFGAVVGSPPFSSPNNQPASVLQPGGRQGVRSSYKAVGAKPTDNYGDSPGQLGAMKEGNRAAVVSSPPFAGNSGGRGEASRNGIDAALFDRHSGGMTGGMGEDERNLGNLPVRGFAEAVVSSPPFENQNGCNDPKYQTGRINGGGPLYGDYGTAAGQLGNDQGETFWAAARAILLQCAMVLPSGAPAVWVTKRFVKNGQIVDFTGQWIELCEACGFRLLHHHRAWLVKNQGVGQVGIDGEIDSRETKKASFFRRLHELRRPDLAINWEDVVCTVRL